MKSKLCAYAEETNLVEITEGGTVFLLHADAAASWVGMKQAAHADGIDIYIVSAFRSIARQAQIIELKRARGLSEQEIFRVNTPPGFSEHHTGRALDLNSRGFAALEVEFEISPAFQWLRQNANRFHFYLSYPENNAFGMIYEPWHWFYNPKTKPPNLLLSREGIL